jgi:hypothetical protein
MRPVSNRIVIGVPDGDRIEIAVLGRAHPGATDYWDGNWVLTPLLIHIGGFTGNIGAQLRTDELHRFSDGLRHMQHFLDGSAVLASLEHWIELTVTCEPNGHLKVVGVVADRPGTGNRLSFAIEGLDQTFLPALIDALDAIAREYPVIGQR